MQMLSALSYLHSHGAHLNSVGSEIIWLREDLSLAVAYLVHTGCAAIGVEGQSSNDLWVFSQWSQVALANPRPCGCNAGTAKGDIFDWAVWLCELMTDGKRPKDLIHDPREPRVIESLIERGEFDDWPQLDAEHLGPALGEAWRGQYESAEEVLNDVRKYLVEAGKRITGDLEDAIDGFEWQEDLEVAVVMREIELRAGPFHQYDRVVLRVREQTIEKQRSRSEENPATRP
jgi:hypothetical protein